MVDSRNVLEIHKERDKQVEKEKKKMKRKVLIMMETIVLV